MASNSSILMLGIAVGTAIGVFTQRFYSSPRGRALKNKARCKLHKMRNKTEEALLSAKEKAEEIGSEILDKTEDMADTVVNKVKQTAHQATSPAQTNKFH